MEQALIKRLTKHRKVVHKYVNVLLYHVGEDGEHTPLKGRRRITQPKGHPPISKYTKWTSEGCLLLIFWSYRNLIVPRIPIQKAIKGLASQPLNHLVHEW